MDSLLPAILRDLLTASIEKWASCGHECQRIGMRARFMRRLASWHWRCRVKVQETREETFSGPVAVKVIT